MKRIGIGFLIFMIVGVFTLSGCRQAGAKIDYGPTVMEVRVEPVPFEDAVKECDLLLTAKCTGVEPKTPAEGYTKYVLDVEEVLGGTYTEKQVWFCIPRADVDGFGPIGTDEYEVGKRYLIPLTRGMQMFTPIVMPAAFGMSIDLTDGRYRYQDGEVAVPDGLSITEYAVMLYTSAPHKEPEPKKTYPDEMAEFLGESDCIARLKVVEVMDGIDSEIAYCQCIEQYRGAPLSSFREDGLISVACVKGSVKEGEEYIIGVVGAGAYRVATETAVKQVGEELISILQK